MAISNIFRPIPILVARLWRRKLDYAKISRCTVSSHPTGFGGVGGWEWIRETSYKDTIIADQRVKRFINITSGQVLFPVDAVFGVLTARSPACKSKTNILIHYLTDPRYPSNKCPSKRSYLHCHTCEMLAAIIVGGFAPSIEL